MVFPGRRFFQLFRWIMRRHRPGVPCPEAHGNLTVPIQGAENVIGLRLDSAGAPGRFGMRTAARVLVLPSALAALLAIPSLAGSEDCNRNGVPDDRDVLPVNFGFARGASLFADADSTHMAAGDLDGDGRDDIATAGLLRIQVHLASQGGGFQEPVAFVVQDPIDITAADLEMDGTEELLVTQGVGRSVLVLALEDRGAERVLSTLASLPIAGPPYPVTLHDFDADGDLDLAVGSIAGGDDFQIQLFIQDGLSFEDVPISGVGPSFFLIGSLDADTDGRADLITIN